MRPAPRQNDEPVTAFVNVNVVPMDHEGIIPNQTVIVRDGKISAIGTVATTAVPKNATVISEAT